MMYGKRPLKDDEKSVLLARARRPSCSNDCMVVVIRGRIYGIEHSKRCNEQKMPTYDYVDTNVYDISTGQRIVETHLKCMPSSGDEALMIAEICCGALNVFCALHDVKNVQEYIDKSKGGHKE